jgi:hypothetical protein
MAIEYPKTLPLPLQEGYGMQVGSPLQRTEMESGRARQRRKFSNVPTIIDVAWMMTEGQAQLFEAWFRFSIKDGAEWFECPLRTPMGLKQYVARFTDIYSGPTLVGGSHWRFSARIELRERQTLGSGWVDVYEYIIHSDIFDRAMNREWPRT